MFSYHNKVVGIEIRNQNNSDDLYDISINSGYVATPTGSGINDGAYLIGSSNTSLNFQNQDSEFPLYVIYNDNTGNNNVMRYESSYNDGGYLLVDPNIKLIYDNQWKLINPLDNSLITLGGTNPSYPYGSYEYSSGTFFTIMPPRQLDVFWEYDDGTINASGTATNYTYFDSGYYGYYEIIPDYLAPNFLVLADYDYGNGYPYDNWAIETAPFVGSPSLSGVLASGSPYYELPYGAYSGSAGVDGSSPYVLNISPIGETGVGFVTQLPTYYFSNLLLNTGINEICFNSNALTNTAIVRHKIDLYDISGSTLVNPISVSPWTTTNLNPPPTFPSFVVYHSRADDLSDIYKYESTYISGSYYFNNDTKLIYNDQWELRSQNDDSLLSVGGVDISQPYGLYEYSGGSLSRVMMPRPSDIIWEYDDGTISISGQVSNAPEIYNPSFIGSSALGYYEIAPDPSLVLQLSDFNYNNGDSGISNWVLSDASLFALSSGSPYYELPYGIYAGASGISGAGPYTLTITSIPTSGNSCYLFNLQYPTVNPPIVCWEIDPTFDVDTGNLDQIFTGSGVHLQKDVTFFFDILDQQLNTVSSNQQFVDNPLISGCVFDVLNIDGTTAVENFFTGKYSRSVTVSASDNENIFGTYQRDFGVRCKLPNTFDGSIFTGVFLAYGNIPNILNIIPNYAEFSGAPQATESFSAAIALQNDLKFIQMDRYDVYALTGSGSAVNELTFLNPTAQEGYLLSQSATNVSDTYNLTINKNGLIENVPYYFTVVPYGVLGSGSPFVFGPTTFVPKQTNLILPTADVSALNLYDNTGFSSTVYKTGLFSSDTGVLHQFSSGQFSSVKYFVEISGSGLRYLSELRGVINTTGLHLTKEPVNDISTEYQLTGLANEQCGLYASGTGYAGYSYKLHATMI